MYPSISPSYRLESTINHYLYPEKIIGFKARNKKLGRPAVLLKEDAIQQNNVYLPEKTGDYIIEEKAELAILDDDTVRTISPHDFLKMGERRNVSDDSVGRDATVFTYSFECPNSRVWNESEVEVTS